MKYGQSSSQVEVSKGLFQVGGTNQPRYQGRKQRREYIGVVKIWGGDRRVDRSLRLVDVSYSGSNTIDGELEEQFDFYFKGKKFHTKEWSPAAASWHNCAVQLPEGVRHTLHSYIDLLVTNWCYDDINEIWWDWYQEEFSS
jgi:hypothetical protein